MHSKDHKDYQRDVQYQKEFGDRNDSKNTTGFLLGAIIGGIVGAATAMFLAPKSGRELRSKLNEQAKILTDKTERLRQTAIEKGTELAEIAKTKTSVITDSVSKQSASLITKVKGNKADEDLVDTSDTETIPAEIPTLSSGHLVDDRTAQIKLEETKKAFEETENQYKH
jgi:gas vesicle protein